ncbi:Eco57I restriction-modification methylase domain-containing protein [Crassaminicella indica]|uniref:site-specific DNA-methyltransferase (adenine-specific) n=1 Tax=Crassaminicella indica TaxID=2855394 RepID=A0ABX8RAZ2_9CLOT|nr:DNA methyltransferase [Crassaminicella indica]QXM06218.1 N-6 DNA methylase [Crassaminicella indica]
MQNLKWKKFFDAIVRNTEQINIKDSDFILEICKVIFLKKYGMEALKNIGVFIREDIKDQFELNENLNLEDFDFAVFSQIYDNYLSLNRREKTGSFYTPYYIIDYMVQRALEIYLSRETGFSEEYLKKYFFENNSLDKKELLKILKAFDEIRMIDISCGTGLFLIGAFRKIYEYKKNIYRVLGRKEEDFFIRKNIVENNLFGIDIQREPTIVGKMALYDLVCGQQQKGYPHIINITKADSLIDENLFGKEKEFDIVIGNPPYLGEKGNKDLFDGIKNTPFGKKYYEGKMDYFYFFIYKALEILKEKGILAYITTNYFVTADGAVKLRDFFKNHCSFIDIINFNDYEIFKAAKGQHNIIFFIANDKHKHQSVCVKYVKEKNIDPKDMYQLLCGNKKAEEKVYEYEISNQEKLYDRNGHILIQEDYEYDSILKKLYNRRQCILKDVCNVNQGIVSGADKVTKDMVQKKIPFEITKKRNIIMNQGIFVLSHDEASELGFLGLHYLKPMYKNSDIQRYCVKSYSSKYVLYINDKTKIEKKVLQHLSRYKEVLEGRRETIRGIRQWYALQWPRNQEIFENMKIVAPHRAKENKFALNCSSWYASADVYFITSKEKNIDFYMLLGLLNSKIMYFWLYNRGKRKGDYLELYATPLKNLPIIYTFNQCISEKIRSIVKEMVQFGENHTAQEKIDKIFYDLYELTSEEIEVIENLYKRNVGK